MDLTDHLLIAMPSIRDPGFHRTVTLICAHDKEGAMGFILNHPMNLTLDKALQKMDIEITAPDAEQLKKQVVLRGGPMMTQNAFIIHHPSRDWDNVLQVNDEVAVATSDDILHAIAKGAGPEKMLMIFGYASWGPGQLEQEYCENSWLSCPSDTPVLFDIDFDKRWEYATRGLGVDPLQLSSLAGHA